MIGYIYLATIAINWLTLGVYSKTFKNRLLREGYKIVDRKKSFSEKAAVFLHNVFYSVLPIGNIIMPVMILTCTEKLYINFVLSALEKGLIYYPKERENSENKEDSSFEKESVLNNVSSYQKDYEKMTIEEKLKCLQAEKEKLLSQIETDKDNDNKFVMQKTKK